MNKVKEQLEKSGLVSNADDLLKDGWGDLYTIDVPEGSDKILIISKHDERVDDKDNS